MMSKRNNLTYKEFRNRFQYNEDKDCIGKGGQSKVFKAFDNYRHRYVAIKVSNVDIENENTSLKRETELVQQLSPGHPNIAYYEECYRFNISHRGEFKCDHAILDYYENGNLLDFSKKTSLTIEQKLSILKEILDGIDFLHTNKFKKIIHRDLKPENILIKEEKGKYIPIITDFGISKEIKIDETSFPNSVKMATQFYAAPEQLSDDDIDYNTDLWSFGIIALVFLGVLLPNDKKIWAQIKEGTLPPIDFLPEAWQTLIKKCLIADPKKRINSCKDCLSIIADYERVDNIHNETNENTENENITQKISQSNKKRKRWWKLIAIIIAGVSVIFFLIINKQNLKISYIEQGTPTVKQKPQIHNGDTILRFRKDIKPIN